MALEGVDIKTFAYSQDQQRWSVRINKNVYDFYGVNLYIKKKLNQYIKHNNKEDFFDLLRSLDYENMTKKSQQFYSPQKDDDKESDDEQQKGGDGEQLSLFDESSIYEDIKQRLRQHVLTS